MTNETEVTEDVFFADVLGLVGLLGFFGLLLERIHLRTQTF